MPPPPRGVEERIRWFLSNSPGGVGMCARHSWRSLGGDRGNPPAWGSPDANSVHDKVKAAGRYWITSPPRGALVLWRYGRHGHAAISYGDGRIATTDPDGPAGTGIESITYPRKWGAGSYIWTDTYNGVRFDVGSTMSNNLDYHYSGKPAGVLTVGRDYITLDVPKWDPPRVGLEHTLTYLNITPASWGLNKTIGAVRVRLIRADGDDTGYHDLVVAKDALAAGSALFTIPYWELGDGTPSAVQVRCQGGLVTATISTRYVKHAVVVD